MNNANKKMPSILIVEDDLFIQAILIQSLSEDFNVQAFENGSDAFHYLQEGHIPDIILSDLNIPGMNGMDLLKNIRTSDFHNSIPFVILSGTEDTEVRILCLEQGADEFLVKPFNPRELTARLLNIVRRMKII